MALRVRTESTTGDVPGATVPRPLGNVIAGVYAA